MSKKKMKMLLLLTVLQITFCVQASAGKKQGQKKTLSKKELKSQAALQDLQFDALMIQAAIENDKEYRQIIEENKEKKVLELSEGKRVFFSDLACKLRENHVDESNVLLIENGYRALFNAEQELSSRTMNEQLIMHDHFFINFFRAFELAIPASITEAQLIKYDPYIQYYMKELLDDKFFMIQSNFFEFILRFPKKSIIDIHAQLLSIISMQEEMVLILQEQKIDDSIAQNNLTILRSFLGFVDQVKL